MPLVNRSAAHPPHHPGSHTTNTEYWVAGFGACPGHVTVNMVESCCIQHGVGKDTIFAGAVALVTWPFGGPVWQLQHIAEVLLVTNDTPDGCTEATRHQRLPPHGVKRGPFFQGFTPAILTGMHAFLQGIKAPCKVLPQGFPSVCCCGAFWENTHEEVGVQA